MEIAPENTSGHCSFSTIPTEINGWNWGGFFLGWLWAGYNLTEYGKARRIELLKSTRLWLSWLTFIPFVGLIMCIVLGVKGNKWAWQGKKWDSVEHFKRKQRKWAWWGLGVTVFALVFYIFYDLLLMSFSQTPSQTLTPPIEQRAQDIEEGWIRLRIQDVGSIDYPSNFLDLQSDDYLNVAKETSPSLAALVFQLGKSDFTLQQVGLNDLKPSAFEEYRRVILRTTYLNQGEEVYRANEKYTLSRQELTDFQNMVRDQIRQATATLNSAMGDGDNKVIDPGSVEIVEVNRMFPLVHTYTRQVGDNPVVLVKLYMFFNYDKIHSLSFSYRVQDEEECGDI